MAIFWNHIKGTGNATNNSDGLWTWIEWSKPTNITKIPTELTDALSPEIKIKIGNGSPDKSLGNIITTKANISTYSNWYNYGDLETGNPLTWEWHYKEEGLRYKFDIYDDGPTIRHYHSANYVFQYNHERDNQYACRVGLIEEATRLDKTIIHIDKDGMSLSLPITTTESIFTESTLTAKGKCEALYFNATSDKRAKENITPATFSGLDLINKLPIYTFNYKDKTDVMPGILAQDLLEVQPEELDLVDNIAATGENGDYMNIKESKLIFVLMQAIKEQQAQIEDLKAQIKNLTK